RPTGGACLTSASTEQLARCLRGLRVDNPTAGVDGHPLPPPGPPYGELFLRHVFPDPCKVPPPCCPPTPPPPPLSPQHPPPPHHLDADTLPRPKLNRQLGGVNPAVPVRISDIPASPSRSTAFKSEGCELGFVRKDREHHRVLERITPPQPQASPRPAGPLGVG